MIGIDSNIIINILRDKKFAFEMQNYLKEEIYTSEIVVYEILYGLFASEQITDQKTKELEDFIDSFTYIFPVDRKASVYAAKLGGRLSKEGKIIGDNDILIAGTLLANGCKRFITKNIKDFSKIKELEIIKM